MHDIRAIRETPDPYIKGWDAKGLAGAELVAQVASLDTNLRAAQTAVQLAQAERNEASKKIGQAKATKNEAEAARLMAQVETLKTTLDDQADVERETGEALRELLASLPNLPMVDVPSGADEHSNVDVGPAAVG